MNTSKKGSFSEGMVMAALIRAGYSVALPFDGTLRYDMIFDDGVTLSRVQCKSAVIRNGVVQFRTVSYQRDTKVPSEYFGQVDFFGAYCEENDTVYLVPIADISSAICYLRLDPAKNNQSKGVRWAADYKVV